MLTPSNSQVGRYLWKNRGRWNQTQNLSFKSLLDHHHTLLKSKCSSYLIICSLRPRAIFYWPPTDVAIRIFYYPQWASLSTSSKLLGPGRCRLDGFSSGCWSGASQATKKGDRLKVPEQSYHSATSPRCWKPEERGQQSRLMQVLTQILLVERRVAGLIPPEGIHILPSISR